MRRVLWFRRDLRVDDNPLLSLGGEVLPIFIFDANILTKLPKDDKRVTFIFSCVLELKKELQERGLELKLYFGDPREIFASLSQLGFDEVAASGDYDSYARQRDLEISHILPFNYLHDTYIFRPEEVLKADQTPYLVFTPFYNKAKTLFTKQHLQASPFAEQTLFATDYEGIVKRDESGVTKLKTAIESIGFSPTPVCFDSPHAILNTFELSDYEKRRDIPQLKGTSGLSLHLRFGTLSIREVLRYLSRQKKAGIPTEAFFRQLVFRDFYAYLLYHFPRIEKENYKYRFTGIEDERRFKTFCEAKTGVPIIDAGVNELLQTGNMHNRIRMICASFFTKDLLLPWQWGEAFFAEHLLDYDAASNILSWQWSAGTGVDPQPYFRIFNPYLQSKKFDKDARYIKSFCPELSKIEPKLLHDEDALFEHTIAHYPKPIVRHKEAAKKALEYFREVL
jgi:deoxyribodipyrimidine photo-lyase